MAHVVVTPESFTMVRFEADRIRTVVEDLADRLGVPQDLEVRVEIDETSPRTVVGEEQHGRDLTLRVDSGAFEDLRRPLELSEERVRATLAPRLLRAADRLDPSFGDAPADEALSLQQRRAWEAYAAGRFARAGFAGRRPLRRYAFRMAHGFNDVADAVFDRLWGAERLTWADLVEACTQTAASKGARRRSRRRAPAAAARSAAAQR